MIDGQESFADITGQVMAAKAGYSSLPWVKYMGDHVKAERAAGRDGKVDGSPMGDFRQETVEKLEEIYPPTPKKDVKNLGSYKVFAKIRDLRNRIASSNVPMKDNIEQRNSFANNAKQSPVTHIPQEHGR